METNDNKISSETKAQRKKRRKPKLIGTRKKKVSGKRSTKIENKKKKKKEEDVPPASNKSRNTVRTTVEDNNIGKRYEESSYIKDQPPTKRINELITDEEKKEIESYYYLDLTFVDKRKVKKNISFHADKTYRCKLCQTAYPRLDKCQVGEKQALTLLLYLYYIIYLTVAKNHHSGMMTMMCSRYTFGVTSTCCPTSARAATSRPSP